MRVKRQGSAVHGIAGWPGALPGPARRCTRSPESLQSRPGALRMSKPLHCSGHVHGRESEGSDDRAAQPKTLRGRWCERTIAHPGALPPKPPAYRSGHREGEGVLLCPCPRHYGDTEGGLGPRASPDGRTRIRLQSGLVTVEGARCTGRRPESQDRTVLIPVSVRRERSGAGLTFDNGSAGCEGPSDYAVTGPVTRKRSGMGGGLGWPPIGLLNSKAFEAGRISASALRDEQLETFERRCAWAHERWETIRPQPLPI